MTEPMILQPSDAADSCVIWLHGLGANRYDFMPAGEKIQHRLTTTRFVFPQAPTRPVTVNGGWAMPSWYDILAMGPDARTIDDAQLEASARMVLDLVSEQSRLGIPPERIVLAGFSQGGAVVFHAAYRCADRALGGVMALSTYGPTLGGADIAESSRRTPALCMHGVNDGVVGLRLGQMAQQALIAQEVDVTWKEYDMDHEVTLSQLDDVEEWLAQRLK